MEICILNIGKTGAEWTQKGIETYVARLVRYCKFSMLSLPDIKNAKTLSKDMIKEEEGKLIIGSVSSSDFVVLLDEKGREFNSHEFADWMQKQMNTGRKRLVMVIGGPYGFSSSVYNRADAKIALSRMTFTHEMARLLLLEQVYRGFTILRGEPYHHD